jgi:hypothetical protein
MKKFLLKNKVLISVVGLVLVFGIFGLANAEGSLRQMIAQVAGQIVGNNINSQIGTIQDAGDLLVGGTNPDFQTNWYRFGGVTHVAGSMALNQASNVLCALQSPSNGTSTLVFASVNFKTSSTSATGFEMAQAASATATTTLIGTLQTLAAGASGTTVASTSPQVAIDGKTIFAPSQYFVVKAYWATAASAATLPTGSCRAEWIVNE